MRDFINMGGYGPYVWSAYGLTVLVLAWNWFDAARGFARARRKAALRFSARRAARS